MMAAPSESGAARLRGLRTRAGVVLGVGVWLLAAHAPSPEPICRAPRPVYAEDGVLDGVACGHGDASRLEGPVRLLFGRRLDLNDVPADALAVLPRIGAQRARALADARPFSDSEAMESVGGIGPITARAVAAWSCFDAADCERPLPADWLEAGSGGAR